VSGLTSASVIIESDDKGGSMITASIALDQGREVFALPGDVDRPMSRGPNSLLFNNRAKPFRTGEDILASLEWLTDPSKKTSSKLKTPALHSKEERQIYALLEAAGEPIHIDTIIERSELDVQTVNVKLLEMEFNDAIRQLPGKHFSVIF
jgi:DNA processing protein